MQSKTFSNIYYHPRSRPRTDSLCDPFACPATSVWWYLFILNEFTSAFFLIKNNEFSISAYRWVGQTWLSSAWLCEGKQARRKEWWTDVAWNIFVWNVDDLVFIFLFSSLTIITWIFRKLARNSILTRRALELSSCVFLTFFHLRWELSLTFSQFYCAAFSFRAHF